MLCFLLLSEPVPARSHLLLGQMLFSACWASIRSLKQEQLETQYSWGSKISKERGMFDVLMHNLKRQMF